MALSIVGCDRLSDSGYMRAKVEQEKLIRESSIPYSLVRATQFLEFVNRIADSATEGNMVHLPPVRFQPMAADDVASAVARVAMGTTVEWYCIVEVGRPEQFPFDELIRLNLRAHNDSRDVIADPHARYFGTELTEYSLVPNNGALLGEIRFKDLPGQPAGQTPATPQAATAVVVSKGAGPQQ